MYREHGYITTVNVVLLAIALTVIAWATYRVTRTPCNTSIAYRVGSVDPRFNLPSDQFDTVLGEAAAVWEDTTGYDLFTEQSNAALPVNLVFDDRQAEFLSRKQLASEITDQSGSYDDLRAEFEADRVAYEAAVRALNQEIESYNQQGGAPPDKYQELEARRRALNQQADTLNARADQLNSMAGSLNEKVDTLNTDVGRMFDQGEYTGDTINIYQFDTIDDLSLVLAHEFGHALGLDHVENSHSVMYYLMKDQDVTDPQLTQEDRAALTDRCAAPSLTTLFERFKSVGAST